MTAAPKPQNEADRLAALRKYQILDTPPEREFDEVVALASAICQTPISTITMIDDSRQWHKAFMGPLEREGNRDSAFCAHAILDDKMLIVTDAYNDSRFSDNPYVIGNPKIRFYAGMPLVNSDGFKLGTLCVIDQQPKELSESQQLALKLLGQQVVKQLELRRAAFELRRMNDFNNRLISIISHDLRSPMVSLHGLLELSEKYNLSGEDFQTFLKKVRAQFNNVNDLLSNLLGWAISQISHPIKSQPESVNLLEQSNLVLAAHSAEFERKTNVIVNNISATATTMADENTVKTILRNLILNANKFTSHGTIELRSQTKNEFIEIAVQDSGVGIEPPRLNNLLAWSEKKNTVGTSGETGSGLALAICHDFVLQYGGHMRVESKVGEGSTFFFTLPSAGSKE